MNKKNDPPCSGQADIKKEFVNRFNSLARVKQAWQVWSDFVEVAAISLSEVVDRYNAERRAERRTQIMNQYTDEQQRALARLYEYTLEALKQNPEQDFLGELFMKLGLSNHWKGQFFTPYSICSLMARIQVGDAKKRMHEGLQDWISINDPACGAGATLIAARNEMKRQRIECPTRVLFVAQDIDRVAGMMCYVQLSILDCAGYVVIANTLTDPLTGTPLLPKFSDSQEVWFMPAFFTEPWYRRILNEYMASSFE